MDIKIYKLSEPNEEWLPSYFNFLPFVCLNSAMGARYLNIGWLVYVVSIKLTTKPQPEPHNKAR